MLDDEDCMYEAEEDANQVILDCRLSFGTASWQSFTIKSNDYYKLLKKSFTNGIQERNRVTEWMTREEEGMTIAIHDSSSTTQSASFYLNCRQ